MKYIIHDCLHLIHALFKHSPPKKLYKYLSAEGAKAFFNSPSVWFRLANKLNDPYDMEPVGSDGSSTAGIGVFCLSETAESEHMWAHYGSAKNGTFGEGVVLEFSTNSDFFKKYPPLPIYYSTFRFLIKNRASPITTKNSIWKYEREWRCFSTVWDAGSFLPSHQVISLPFPFEALTAVIYGSNCSISSEARVFLDKHPEVIHVQEFVCRYNEWQYGFRILPLSDISHIIERQKAVMWGRFNKR